VLQGVGVPVCSRQNHQRQRERLIDDPSQEGRSLAEREEKLQKVNIGKKESGRKNQPEGQGTILA